MSEALKYVSPEYQEQLEELAEQLVTPERFGGDVLKTAGVEVSES